MKDRDWKKLTFTKVGAANGIVPDAPNAAWDGMEIENAEEILIFTDSTATAHTSANWDLNVYIGFFAGTARGLGDLTWETVASFEETGLGDDAVARIRVDDTDGNILSGLRLKVLADCNANNLLADVYIWVRKRPLC